MSEHDENRLTRNELRRLRTTQASPALLAIVRVDPEVAGVSRNSAREHVRQRVRGTNYAGGALTDRLVNRGGDFFTALFDGNVGSAFVRADGNNTRILLDRFSREYLIERLVADEGFDADRAARYVDERIDRYGDGMAP